MAQINLTSIKKSFGAVEVLHGIDLDIEAGEFVVFVGPSGCGKSTLLRLIAGLEEIGEGSIAIGGQEVNALPPAQRGIAMVFQSYALYPHMSVYDNMAFGLKLARMPKAELDQRVRRAAEMLQLTPYLDRLPKQLSGGQRQRVAIGRAITRDPKVFLFDEPLSNLDAALRVATRIEIANLKEQMPETTMVYVTHDQVEAMTLADRIVVLNAGNIEQVGTPMELYRRPRNLFVAGFIGSPAMNIVPARVKAEAGGASVTLPGGRPFALPVDLAGSGEGEMQFGIRPEHLVLAEPGQGRFTGTVAIVEELGEVTIVHFNTADGQQLIAKLDSDRAVARGDTIDLGFDTAQAHLFGTGGNALMRTGG